MSNQIGRPFRLDDIFPSLESAIIDVITVLHLLRIIFSLTYTDFGQMQERIRTERNQKGFIEFEQTIEPLTTDGKKGAMATVRAIDEFGQAKDEGSRAKKTEPEISQSNGDHQAVQAIRMAQAGGLEIEAVTLEVAKEGLGPRSFAIPTLGGLG
jgi:hypothetical protein